MLPNFQSKPRITGKNIVAASGTMFVSFPLVSIPRFKTKLNHNINQNITTVAPKKLPTEIHPALSNKLFIHTKNSGKVVHNQRIIHNAKSFIPNTHHIYLICFTEKSAEIHKTTNNIISTSISIAMFIKLPNQNIKRNSILTIKKN